MSLSVEDKLKGIMLWFGNEKPTGFGSKTRLDVKISGLKLKEPVYVDLITGRVFELTAFKTTSKGMKFRNLSLWDAPIIIMEADSFRWNQVNPKDSFRKTSAKPAPPVKKITDFKEF